VKADILAVGFGFGFEFAGESEVLRPPEGDRTKSVLDPSIRGRTDRFIYKFKKPDA